MSHFEAAPGFLLSDQEFSNLLHHIFVFVLVEVFVVFFWMEKINRSRPVKPWPPALDGRVLNDLINSGKAHLD